MNYDSPDQSILQRSPATGIKDKQIRFPDRNELQLQVIREVCCIIKRRRSPKKQAGCGDVCFAKFLRLGFFPWQLCAGISESK